MIYQFIFRPLGVLFSTVLIVFLMLHAGPAKSAELVMFESAGCEWCEIWDEEIGVIYDKTSEAEIVPLRRVDIDDDRPADLPQIDGVVYTPTFVVIQDGREIGRIIGYPGEDFFWQILNQIIASI